jgi:hypothetical protein
MIQAKGYPSGTKAYATPGTIWVPGDKWNELWNATYHVNGDIALSPGEYSILQLYVDSGATLGCQGDPSIVNSASGGTSENPHGSGVTINATNITVDGIISVYRSGFSYGQGPGVGDPQTGGGYGGKGGDYSTYQGGPTYGVADQPSALGSGGRASGNHHGGRGGGAMKLVVSDTLAVNGTLSANGETGPGQFAGGGSGGSIWIDADTLAGSGSLTATGGSGSRAGGGGGRIAAYFNLDTSSLSTNAAVDGGTGGYNDGDDGTIGGDWTIP